MDDCTLALDIPARSVAELMDALEIAHDGGGAAHRAKCACPRFANRQSVLQTLAGGVPGFAAALSEGLGI